MRSRPRGDRSPEELSSHHERRRAEDAEVDRRVGLLAEALLARWCLCAFEDLLRREAELVEHAGQDLRPRDVPVLGEVRAVHGPDEIR
jgi:hypothetical protein